MYHSRGTFFPELFKNSMSLGHAESLLDVIIKIVQNIFYVLFGALSSFLCYSEFPSKKSFGGKYDLIESCVFFIIKTIRLTKPKLLSMEAGTMHTSNTHVYYEHTSTLLL